MRRGPITEEEMWMGPRIGGGREGRKRRNEDRIPRIDGRSIRGGIEKKERQIREPDRSIPNDTFMIY